MLTSPSAARRVSLVLTLLAIPMLIVGSNRASELDRPGLTPVDVWGMTYVVLVVLVGILGARGAWGPAAALTLAFHMASALLLYAWISLPAAVIWIAVASTATAISVWLVRRHTG